MPKLPGKALKVPHDLLLISFYLFPLFPILWPIFQIYKTLTFLCFSPKQLCPISPLSKLMTTLQGLTKTS